MDLDRYSTEIFWDEDDQGYIALARELPGCSAFGTSKEDALRELKHAMKAWIESAEKAGNPVPEPAKRPEFSGKLMVRMPKSLHAKLAASAGGEGVSLNQYVVSLLSSAQEARFWKPEVSSLGLGVGSVVASVVYTQNIGQMTVVRPRFGGPMSGTVLTAGHDDKAGATFTSPAQSRHPILLQQGSSPNVEKFHG